MIWRPLSDFLGDVFAPREDFAGAAMCASARALSAGLAERTRLDAAEVFDALTYVPEPMLSLLTSPDGWAALSAYVAAERGLAPVVFRPTVH